MSSSLDPAPRVTRFPLPWVQLSRAGIAAIAALMITFSRDHSAPVGLAVFSGFGIATALILGIAAWLTYPAGKRWFAVAIAIVSVIAGMTAGVTTWRNTVLFFAVVAAWAILTGFFETLWAARERKLARAEGRDTAEARDGLTIGILTLVLGVVLPLIPAQYALDYSIEGAGDFTLTGITIAVGVFGGYAAIVAVFLAIAGLSPRRTQDARPATAGGSGAESTPATGTNEGGS